MHLVIDVGNTETVVGLLGEEPVEGAAREVRAHWRLSTAVPRTADELALLLEGLLARGGIDPSTVSRGVIGSVVPSVTARLRAATADVIEGPVYLVTGDGDLPIRLDVEEPRTVGADRIVNTLAAKELFGRDTVVVDLGTATTFDCITADGVFQGGVISPGVLTGAEWLGARTAKLPRVELDPPERVIGRRTEACIRSGVFWGNVEAVDGLVRRIVGEWAREAFVVATGGYASVLGPHLAEVDRIEPFLTLQGLGMAGDHMAERAEAP